MRRCPLRHRSLRSRSRQLLCRIGDGVEIWRVEIIFSGDADQGEKRIPPGIGECGSHSLRRGDVGDWANRPFRGNPFTGGMRKDGGESKEPGFFVDFRGLDGRDLVPPEALADYVQAA